MYELGIIDTWWILYVIDNNNTIKNCMWQKNPTKNLANSEKNKFIKFISYGIMDILI